MTDGTKRKAARNGASGVTGALLIHGYGGTPFEMEGLATALTGAGGLVRNICLPGHGDEKEAFSRYRFTDWLAFAEREFAALAAVCARVVVVGFSMGGTIALHMGARFPVAGVVTISTPIYLLRFFPWPLTQARFYFNSGNAQIRRRLARWFPLAEAGETSRDIAPWKGYAGPLNVRQLLSFRAGCDAARLLLPGVTAPLLAMHDVGDKIVYAGNAVEIARQAGAMRARVVLTRIRETTTRHHMIPTHRETASFVEECVTRFVADL